MKKHKICKILLVILAIFLCVAFYELLGICVAYKKQPEVSNTTKKANNKADMTVENTSASQIAPVRQDRIRNPFSFFCSIIFSPPCIQFHALLRFQNQGYL